MEEVVERTVGDAADGDGDLDVRVEGDEAEGVLGGEAADEVGDGAPGGGDRLAAHRSGAVEHDDDGLAGSCGGVGWHRGGQLDEAGELLVGGQCDQVDVEVGGEVHAGSCRVRAPPAPSPLKGIATRYRPGL